MGSIETLGWSADILVLDDSSVRVLGSVSHCPLGCWVWITTFRRVVVRDLCCLLYHPKVSCFIRALLLQGGIAILLDTSNYDNCQIVAFQYTSHRHYQYLRRRGPMCSLLCAMIQQGDPMEGLSIVGQFLPPPSSWQLVERGGHLIVNNRASIVTK